MHTVKGRQTLAPCWYGQHLFTSHPPQHPRCPAKRPLPSSSQCTPQNKFPWSDLQGREKPQDTWHSGDCWPQGRSPQVHVGISGGNETPESSVSLGPTSVQGRGGGAEAGSWEDRSYRTKVVPRTQWPAPLLTGWGFTTPLRFLKQSFRAGYSKESSPVKNAFFGQ